METDTLYCIALVHHLLFKFFSLHCKYLEEKEADLQKKLFVQELKKQQQKYCDSCTKKPLQTQTPCSHLHFLISLKCRPAKKKERF